MREPKLGQLKIDEPGTAKLRAALAGGKAVRITINIKAKSLQALSKASQQTGVPYQALLSRLLKDGAKSRETTEARLDRLERELKRMKRDHVA
jgi:predicted DNA binding CopG/RHH family protein